MMSNKSLKLRAFPVFVALGFLMLAVMLAYYVAGSKSQLEENNEVLGVSTETNHVQFSVKEGLNKQIYKNIQVDGRMNLLDYFRLVSQTTQFDYTLRSINGDVVIKSVNSINAASDESWVVVINKEILTTDLSKHQVSGGDEVEIILMNE